MKILLISGKSGHGKDTFAQMLKEQLELKKKTVLIIRFGDAVKWFARTCFNWDGEKNEFGRTLLQTIGTDRLRTKFPTYWADIVAKFLAAIPVWDYVLIPDWRFENELETIDTFLNNIYTFRIERYENNELYHNPAMNKEQLNHISECELDNCNSFDWTIEHSTLEELKQSAELILDYLENL